MKLDEIITARRSVRKYKDREVKWNDIERMIQSATLAPSWKNSQTARYYVVKSTEMLAKVKTECLPEFNAINCKDAPVLIVTTFVKNRSGYERDGNPSNELGNQWGAYDLGLQNQNLLLKATELGLGTLVMGIRNEKALRGILSIPETESVVSVISVGYPNSNPEVPKRKDMEDIITVL